MNNVNHYIIRNKDEDYFSYPKKKNKDEDYYLYSMQNSRKSVFKVKQFRCICLLWTLFRL